VACNTAPTDNKTAETTASDKANFDLASAKTSI
jgi:hypothetical protein